MTEYPNVLAYLYSLEKFGIVFGLENIQWILDSIGNPHGFLKTVHIGGTNGKGSVAAMLSHILKAAGYRVGKYTSPHLVSFTERITINEEEITETEVAELTAYIRGQIESVDPNSVVTGAQDAPQQIIEETGNSNDSPVYVMGRDFSYEKKGPQSMSYSGLSSRLNDIFVNLKGDHQLANAAIALCAAELLSSLGFGIDQREFYTGLSRVTWPGRLEIVREKPVVILDGAHNVDGIRALAGFLTSQFPGRRRLLIFGVMKDKEYEKMLGELLPHVDETILTVPKNDRALLPEFMQKIAPKAIVADDVTWALKKAKSMSTDEDVIVITGSLYLVGECKTVINDIF